MKVLANLLLIFVIASKLAAVDDTKEAVRLFFSQTPVTFSEPSGKLTMSGDCISQWLYTHTTSHGEKLRGSGARDHWHGQIPIPTNQFMSQVDLIFDYQLDPTYARIQFEFLNNMGILTKSRKRHVNTNKNVLFGSGRFKDIELIKAFMGYSLLDKEKHKLTFEIGRRQLFDIFDSKIQFNNQFDGIVLTYWRSNDRWGVFKAQAAGFVIDDSINQFGYAGEVDFLSFCGSKLDLKYSLITWERRGHNRFGKRHPLGSRFVNSQLLAAYGLPDIFNQDPSIYMAAIHNHAATPNWHTNHRKAANAFYAGVTVGQVKKKNDWSLDCNYQWVQAQSIPEADVSGITRDNPLGISMYDQNWAGYANYKGYVATFVYGVSDNLSVSLLYQRVHQASAAIGGKFRSSSLQLSATYTF